MPKHLANLEAARWLVGWLVGWLVFLPLCCMLHAQHNSMCGACTFYLFSSGVQNSLWVSEMCCWSWGWQFTWTIIKRRKARFIVHLQDRFLYNFFCVCFLPEMILFDNQKIRTFFWEPLPGRFPTSAGRLECLFRRSGQGDSTRIGELLENESFFALELSDLLVSVCSDCASLVEFAAHSVRASFFFFLMKLIFVIRSPECADQINCFISRQKGNRYSSNSYW